MLDVYKRLYRLLDARERRRAALVVCLLLAVALVETLGVASVMPFIAVLAKPELIQPNAYLAMVLLGSLAVKEVVLWAQLRFSQNRTHTCVMRLMFGYLAPPYDWFRNGHSAKYDGTEVCVMRAGLSARGARIKLLKVKGSRLYWGLGKGP